MTITQAKISDEVLSDIRDIILLYLDESSIDGVPDTDLVDSFEFLSQKFFELKNIKSLYNTGHEYTPFLEVEKHIDEYKIAGTFTTTESQNLHIELSKDVDSALAQVGLFYGILKKIMKERDIFKH